MKAGNSLVYSPKIRLLEKHYFSPSLVRAIICARQLEEAVLITETRHHPICWNPAAGEVPQSPLPAVPTFCETTNDLKIWWWSVKSCVLQGQLHEFAARCIGQRGAPLTHLHFLNHTQYQRAPRRAQSVWKLVFRWYPIYWIKYNQIYNYI